MHFFSLWESRARMSKFLCFWLSSLMWIHFHHCTHPPILISSEVSVFVTPPSDSQHPKLTSVLKLVIVSSMKKGGTNVIFLIWFVRWISNFGKTFLHSLLLLFSGRAFCNALKYLYSSEYCQPKSTFSYWLHTTFLLDSVWKLFFSTEIFFTEFVSDLM